MSDSTVWWLLTAAAVALELLNGSFYLLMLGIGLAAAALAAHLGAGMALQLTAAALVGGGAVLFWSQRMRQRPGAGDSADNAGNADLNLDIGQLVQVEHWNADGSASFSFNLTLEPNAPAAPQLLVAVATDKPLPALDKVPNGVTAQSFMPFLEKQLKATKVTPTLSFGFFRLEH